MNPRTHNLHNLKMWCTIWMLRSHSFFALWTCEWRCSNSWHFPWHWRRLAFPGYKVRNSFHVTDLCLTIQLQASRKTSLYSIFYINMYIYIYLCILFNHVRSNFLRGSHRAEPCITSPWISALFLIAFATKCGWQWELVSRLPWLIKSWMGIKDDKSLTGCMFASSK